MLNPFMKALDFLPVQQQVQGHALLREEVGKVAGVLTVVKKEPTVTEGNPECAVVQEPPLPALQVQATTGASADDHDVAPPPPKRAHMDVDDWLADVVCTGQEQTPVKNVMLEVDRYLGTEVTGRMSVLLWWGQNSMFYPHIASLARKYHAISASSVPSERVFSLSDQLVSKKRARLSPKNVDNMVFFNKNRKLYWD